MGASASCSWTFVDPSIAVLSRWLMAAELEFDLRPEFYYTIRRNAEELCRAARVLRHEHE